MALVVKDRVKQFSVTSGTGTLTLGATPNGFQSFSAIGDGNTTYYAIVNGSTGDWEVGIGTYTATGDTLSRDSVLASSNSGNLVNFNSDSKEVFVVYSAEKAVFTDVIQTLTNKTINGSDNTITNVSLTTGVTGTLPIANGGTGQTTAGAAINALLPSQTSQSGRYLTTDGTNPSWAAVPAPNNGTLTMNVSGTGLSGSATFTADQAGASTFTVTSNATSANTANTIVARDASGNFSAGTITAALSGNASTATNLSTDRNNWATNGTLSAVVGQLVWRNYGNGHTVFDASASLSPSGTSVNNTNAQVPWAGTYPTLMGWNGANTYGVRVDSARVADFAPLPIGATYIQFPGYNAPNTLFGGTWSAIFDSEGIFFRTPGGNASAFGGGIQEDQMQRITGGTTSGYQGAGSNPGTVQLGAILQEATGVRSGTDRAGGGQLSFDSANSSGARTGTETRPRNRTVRVWVRTA
jgi:hypothetical protein